MRSTISDLTSPLSQIANDIASLWLLLPFPNQLQKNGLLEFSSNKCDPKILERPIHGFENACRVAGLIKVLFTLYQTHKEFFIERIQKEIDAISEEQLKKIQIVGLMRSTGRTRDGDSGHHFSEQGKKECVLYLQALGATNASELAESIVLSEISDPNMSLVTALLADATLLETIRDGRPYDVKKIPFTIFRFYQFLQAPRVLRPVEDLIKVCLHDAQLIAKHNTYLRSAIVNANGLPICSGWPLTMPDVSVDTTEAQSHQNTLEKSPDCFTQIYQDVLAVLNKEEPAAKLPTPNKLFDSFFEFLGKIKIEWNLTDNSKYIAFILHFMHNNMGMLIDSGQGYCYEFDWKYMEHVLQFKLGSQYYEYFAAIKKLVTIYDESEEAYYHLFSQHADALRDQQYLRLMSLHESEFRHSRNEITRRNYGNVNHYAIKLTGFQEWYLRLSPEICTVEKCPGVADDVQSAFKLPDKRAIKVLRFDYLCHIHEFLSGIRASAEKPDRTRLRFGAHKRYSATSLGVVERSKKESAYPKDLPAPLAAYSKHQSFTFVDDTSQNAVFSPNNKDTNKLAGYLFNAAGALVNRAHTENIGSYTRPYESHSLEKAKKFYERHFVNKSYYKKVDGGRVEFDLDLFLKNAAPLKLHNEVMVRVRLIPGETAACIFGNTLEGRSIARMYADLLKENAPILFYLPGNTSLHFKEYTPEMQQNDTREANDILDDAEKCYNKFNEENFEFLISVDSPSAAFSVFYQLKPIVFHLFEHGLFHLADYLFERLGIPGTLCDYIKHQMDYSEQTGYDAKFFSTRMLIRAATKGRLDVLKLVLEVNPTLANQLWKGSSTIVEAAFYGHIAVVRYLIAKNVKLNLRATVNKTPESALYWAVKHCHHEIVSALLIAGAEDRELYGKHKRSLMHISVVNGDLKMVKILYAKSTADLFIVDANGRNSLQYAVQREHVDIIGYFILTGDKSIFLELVAQGHTKHVLAMLERFPALLNCHYGRRTGLFIAAANNHLSLVKLFLEKKADTEIAADNIDTPLVVACRKGHRHVVSTLLDHGANQNLAISDEKQTVTYPTLLKFAIVKKYKFIVLSLLKHKKDEPLSSEFTDFFISLVKNDDAEFFKGAIALYPSLLTMPPFDKQSRRKYEVYTLLEQFIARKQSQCDIINCILAMEESGVIAEYIESFYLISAIEGNLEVFKTALLKHPNLLNRSMFGSPALHFAAARDRQSIVEYLIEAKADLNQVDKDGMTALGYAAKNGYVDTVKMLLAAKTVITLNTIKHTHYECLKPLWHASHLFVGFTELDFIRVVTERKIVSVFVAEIKNIFPLHFAVQSKHLKLVHNLIGDNVKVDVVDKDKKLAQDYGFSVEIQIFCYANAIAKRKTSFATQVSIFGKIVGFRSPYSKEDKLAAVNRLKQFIFAVDDNSTEVEATTNALIPHLGALEEGRLGNLFALLKNQIHYRRHLATLPTFTPSPIVNYYMPS